MPCGGMREQRQTVQGHATATARGPLSFAPSEAHQVDWSHEAVELLESCGSAPQKGRPLRGAARRPRTRRDDVQVRSDAGRSERIPGLMEISE